MIPKKRKKILGQMIIIFTGIPSFILFLLIIHFNNKRIPKKEIPTREPEKKMRKPIEFIKELGAGINIGNSLDAKYHETYWGNPRLSQKYFDELIKKGFNAFRIPIRWRQHVSNLSILTLQFKISESFLDRVQQIVNYVYNKKKYVIINLHHSTPEIICNPYLKKFAGLILKKVWKQIAERFKNYDYHLIFEVMNEPRKKPSDFNGDLRIVNIVNELNEIGRKTIRETGSLNKLRPLLLSLQGGVPSIPCIDFFKMNENDENLMVTFHTYHPYEIGMHGMVKYFTDKARRELKFIFKLIKEKFIDKGIVALIGEMGMKNYGYNSTRIEYTDILSKYGSYLNIPIFWWDNGHLEVGKVGWGLMNRTTFEYAKPDLYQIMINNYNHPLKFIDLENDNKEVLDIFLRWKKVSNKGLMKFIKPFGFNDGNFDILTFVNETYFILELVANNKKCFDIFYEMFTYSGINKVDCDIFEINNKKFIIIIPFDKFKYVKDLKYLNYFYIQPKKEEIHVLRMTFYPRSLIKEKLNNYNLLSYIKSKFDNFNMKFFGEDCYFQFEMKINVKNHFNIIYESLFEKKTYILDYDISILGNNHYLLVIPYKNFPEKSNVPYINSIKIISNNIIEILRIEINKFYVEEINNDLAN